MDDTIEKTILYILEDHLYIIDEIKEAMDNMINEWILQKEINRAWKRSIEEKISLLINK